MLLQFLITIVVLIVLGEILTRHKKKELSVISLFLWLFIWLSIVVVAWLPDVTFYISRFLNIERGIDSVVYLSIVGLFYLVFRILLKIESLERKIEKVVRKVALKEKD